MSEKSPKVSIVIPIYNVEKYLAECLESVCAQTLREIEIICVNDGSTDSSKSIIEKFMSKDKRVKCVDKKNSGYGNTMNRGFDAATGEYIGIVESDDFMDKRAFEILYNEAKKYDLDLIKSDYYTFYGETGTTEYIHTCPDPKHYRKVIGKDKAPEVFEFRMNTWTGLYKKEFIEKNNIRHNETPGASYQDNGFWFQTISLAERLMYIDQAFYHYRQDNPNSSINSKSKIYCMCDEYDFIYDFLDAHPAEKKKYFVPYFKKRFFNCMTTYHRVSNENKLLFLERFSDDLKKLIKRNNFKISDLQDEWMESIVSRIIDDYELFFYEDMNYKYNEQKEKALEKLKALRESNELKKGLKIKRLLLKK